MTEPRQPDPILWGDDGLPRSRAFGDVYFSSDDGLAESRAVFLDGCGLPDAWAGRHRFVVGELGFGTGLNIAALLDLWRRTRPAAARLHVFTVEAFPVPADDARRALARWPELNAVAQPLLERWPGVAHGLHRLELPPFGAIVDVAVMDVAQALQGWSGAADAWFLDGFSPAVNPAMWSDEVLGLIGARSAPGARAATFTVAGQVRRGLAAAGFEVERRPGFGRKRERLEARRRGQPADARPPSVAVIGAGIAGASLARAVRALGGEATVIEAEAPGAGASGNPGALVTPRLDAGLGDPARLYAQAFSRAVRLYEELPQAILSHGVLQLALTERDRSRFAKIVASDLFEPGALELLAPEAAAARLGEPAPAALDQRSALVIEPRAVLDAWLPETRPGRAVRLDRRADRRAVLDAGGKEIAAADAVVVAAGLATRDLVPALPLQAFRGQASLAAAPLGGAAAAWGGYVLPTRAGVLFGATYDRDDEGRDVRPEDHARNLGTLAKGRPQLAARLAGAELEGRAAVRAAAPDRLPLAGAMGDRGLFVLTGFGARGFTFAPPLAEHLAAQLCGAPSPLSAPLAALVAPDRFAPPGRS
jgi:tRNA 5-methylaminomethyl-2-thiouridine biosynthesis bifunctional protein